MNKVGVHDSSTILFPMTRSVNGMTNFYCYGLSSVSFYKISTTYLNTRWEQIQSTSHLEVIRSISEMARNRCTIWYWL